MLTDLEKRGAKVLPLDVTASVPDLAVFATKAIAIYMAEATLTHPADKWIISSAAPGLRKSVPSKKFHEEAQVQFNTIFFCLVRLFRLPEPVRSDLKQLDFAMLLDLWPAIAIPISVFPPTALFPELLHIQPSPGNILQFARETKFWAKSPDAIAYLKTLYFVKRNQIRDHTKLSAGVWHNPEEAYFPNLWAITLRNPT
ncbi:hypothetical protein B0H11DRAFT_1932931 [Mycena galericulata]|nr:hypothetical protein B0H11DRAFT_1932931 [Mycena galericulata]